jgi:adenylate kinase
MMSEALNIPHISTGDMLREALREQTELGKKAKTFMEVGALVPDKLVDEMVAERLDRKDCRRGYILDGYPRTIPQANFLQSIFAKNGACAMSIGVELADELLIGRLSSRWTCPQCGKMFNASMDPGKIDGQCDECSSRLTKRKDDMAEVVAERLKVYHKTTQPLLEHYRAQGLYFRVDGEKSVKEIFESIMKKITNCE